MSDSRLIRRLAAVAQRQRRLSRLKLLTAVWLAAGAIGLGLHLASVATAYVWLALGIVVTGIVSGFWRYRPRSTDAHGAAVLLERRYSNLDSRLLTALIQERREPGNGYSYLQERVLSDVVEHARRHPWTEAVPTRRLRVWQMAEVASLAGFVAIAFWASRSGGNPEDTVAAVSPVSGLPSTSELIVEPGDVELELGRSLIVTARFSGNPPDSAELVTVDPEGSVQRWPLARSLDDPLFGGRIPQVRSDLTYRVESASELSADYRVETFEYPALVRADAIITPPTYTGRGEERIEDVRRVSHYEGSPLTIVCRFNKPFQSATLTPEQGEALTFGPSTALTETDDDADDVAASVTWQPTVSQTLALDVTDGAGRGLKDPVTLHVEVLPNLPPELAVTFPSRDVQASPLEELSLEATAWDDFGIQEYGLVYRLPSGEERSVVLGNGSTAASESEATLEHLLPLEELNPEARDLLSYSFYADDFDAAGAVRRSFSDVFFAEVRHFDEEYREQRGQPPGG
ncbi:MAG: DUF4175 family protein, partial [Pirellulales bacterium]